MFVRWKVVKDRTLKANHNNLLLGSTALDVVKDRTLKSNHNSAGE